MRIVQYFCPSGNIESQLQYRKFAEHGFQYLYDVLFFHLFAVYRDHGNIPVLFHLLCQCSCFLFVWTFAVKNDHEGFAGFFQLGNGFFFCRSEVLPWDFSEGAIGGNHNAYGGMIVYDFLCSKICCLTEGHGGFGPGGFDEAFFIVFCAAGSIFDQEAYAIDHAKFQFQFVGQADFYGLPGDEFRFYGGDEFSRSADRQLIHGFFSGGFVHVGQGGEFHETADEGGFSGADGAYYA